MDEKIRNAIEVLTGLITSSVKSEDALRYTQAALNLQHVLAVQDNIKNKR
jgi:hypothetical protein